MSTAARPLIHSLDEAESWPRGVSRDPVLSIGQVVSELKSEFPAITLSKVRFLEEQGLVSPARSGAGYRKYSRADVERLRFILAAQRDSFTPLKVIGEQLRSLDAGHEVELPRRARVIASEGRVVAPSNAKAISARDLADLTGATLEDLERYVGLGILTPDMAGYFQARSLQIVQLLLQLEAAGIEARVLRSVRMGAERSADIVDQAVSSQRSRSRASDRERAHAQAQDCSELLADLHREMLRIAVSALQTNG